MSGKGHQKRISAPRTWPIEKKTHKFVTRPSAGPHSKENSLPLMVILRDVIKLADFSREIRRIIHEGQILVDGEVRKNPRFPVGIFDLISIPRIDKHYRILISKKRRIILNQTQDRNIKLCRINNKTTLKKGAVQLNLSDGSNLIGTNEYKTGDSLMLSLPDLKIQKHIPLKPGNLAIVVGGSHSGELARIKEIKIVKSSKPNMIALTATDGKGEFETIEDYVYIVGEEKPVLDLGVVA